MGYNAKKHLRTAGKGCVLTVYLLFTIFPFVWMLLTSFKGSQGEIYAFPVTYIPKEPSLRYYISILFKGDFGRYMLNSAIISTCAAVIAEVIGIMAAYAISRFYANMTIPFTIVTLCGFYDTVPKSLEEAAWIDGCGYLSGLWHIVIPVMKPGIVATLIFAFVNSWNELFLAVMFINSDANKTIPVGLNSLILNFDIRWGEMAAGTVLALIPTIVLFAVAQKYMVEGLTAGAVKE